MSEACWYVLQGPIPTVDDGLEVDRLCALYREKEWAEPLGSPLVGQGGASRHDLQHEAS